MNNKPKITIVFCEGCKWGLRAGWYAQELFSTFNGKIGSIELKVGCSGDFKVLVLDKKFQPPQEALIWCRKRDEGFPEASDLKRRIRDCIALEQSLGHCEIDK